MHAWQPNVRKAKKAKKGDEEPDEATSLGAAGQEERENDLFAELCESGLLYNGRGVLKQVRPLLLSGIGDPTQRCDPVLRRSAALSLCKFMTVSKRFCEDNLQMLFSILFPKGTEICASVPLVSEADAEDVLVGSIATLGSNELLEDQTLRQSLLVAVGDLLFRHPNVVEPWTDRLYAALSVAGSASEGPAVAELRLTALLVLTHLVLNDMMKPRAVLLVRALWLTACPHVPTARVARILFTELSRKTSHPIYNLLPFIVSLLPEHRGPPTLASGRAEDRVRYLMQFIEKEKHVEGLIEKLSMRLIQCADSASGSGEVTNKTTHNDTDHDGSRKSSGHALEMVSCLANALGAMTYTDKSILRLHDVVVVRKSLNVAISYHEEVRENLLAVVERARKSKAGKAGSGYGDGGEGDAAGVAGEGGPPSKSSGMSAAAITALDAMEQLVISLAEGRVENVDVSNAAVPIVDGMDCTDVGVNKAIPTAVLDIGAAVAAIPTPAKATSGTKGNKRKPIMAESSVANDVAEDEVAKEQSKSRAGGKVRGRKPQTESKLAVNKNAGKAKAKQERRSKRAFGNDVEDDED